ncbi:two-component system CheB/CheR fusion protein [Flavobacterium arsenatis]|uniref:Two-component system CheB/CheR fusion protein n=1 Tax=Flavobacterium arsenatis TaxID=1484332 RepID=A0ABU1TTU3_9FLAO|nr:CheR family methyltransferase [Flavobacterium arsenatis]MDR6969290.1 two-component system CheB/CheR fusion protein [Flavobacterium arsenatis]
MTKLSEYSEKKIQAFPVVGIGASAGGLDAFMKFVEQIPHDSGMAYVATLHHPLPEEGNLAKALSALSKIPVVEIINDMVFEANHIYIIPENRVLATEYGFLKLSSRNRNERKFHPIDTFFTSLAEVYKSSAIGVLLSGASSDGTTGLKVIKEFGGATVAQDPETTPFRTMPQNAIDSEATDYILPPESMPSQLLHIRHSFEANYAYTESEHIPEDEEEMLSQIIKIIYTRTGNDFRHYKQPTIRRRIARRMVVTQKEELADYLNYLRNDKAEQDYLFNDLLIPVSYFFRDFKIFESLNDTIFPQLVQNSTSKTLRIWVAGCSTGEEAYSLAISLHEFLLSRKHDIKVQIFASDISERVITKARAGAYALHDLENVSETRLANYFTKREGTYHVNKVIREMCVFAVHNFIKDPPFAKIDMISCRNVLIYFDSFLQNKVLNTFHYALKENGFLFLGKSESAVGVSHLFEAVAKHEKMYVKKFTPGKYTVEASKTVLVQEQKKLNIEQKTKPDTDFRKMASDILFSRFTPAGVVIDEHQDIVHFYGDTGPFLLPSPGKPNFNILKMAREGLSFELRNTLLKVKESGEVARKESIRVKNQNYLVDIEIIPLNTDDHYQMVVFKKKEIIPQNEDDSNKRKTSELKRIAELESELSQLKEDIKRVTEEQQIAFEELQTTNEELLSSSEELQALNDELESSTEELQSNNEELMCVNDELRDRQEQLTSVSNYAESIIRSVREPLIVLDKELRIKSANPAFYSYFKTTELEAEGKAFFDIGTSQWEISELKALFKNVLDDKRGIDDYKIKTIFPKIGERTLMLNARSVIDAVPTEMLLVTLEDVTNIENSNEKLLRKNNELQLYNEQLQSFSWAASHDLQEPLRKITMFSKLILEEDKGIAEKSRYNLERIVIATENMRQLIEDLMGYTRTIAIENELKKTDLNVLLKKTLTDLKDIIKEKDTVVTASVLPKVEVLPQQFQQLFSNLIINSIKYSKDDVQPQIAITADKATDDEISTLGGNPELEYFKISVSDNGIGFPDSQAEKIFDAFFRLHAKDKFRGSGLGLALCRKIVHNHNGFIKATGKIDEGATMMIYIPSKTI